jgi:hypothetical protein
MTNTPASRPSPLWSPPALVSSPPVIGLWSQAFPDYVCEELARRG